MRTLHGRSQEWISVLPATLTPLKRTLENIKDPLYRLVIKRFITSLISGWKTLLVFWTLVFFMKFFIVCSYFCGWKFHLLLNRYFLGKGKIKNPKRNPVVSTTVFSRSLVHFYRGSWLLGYPVSLCVNFGIRLPFLILYILSLAINLLRLKFWVSWSWILLFSCFLNNAAIYIFIFPDFSSVRWTLDCDCWARCERTSRTWLPSPPGNAVFWIRMISLLIQIRCFRKKSPICKIKTLEKITNCVRNKSYNRNSGSTFLTTVQLLFKMQL